MSNVDYSGRLAAISMQLRRVHLALIETEKRSYERQHGIIGGPAQLLQLLSGHEHFAWLRQLSQTIVAIDELRDASTIVTAADAATMRAAVERLLGSDEAGEEGFAGRYRERLQQDPVLAMVHADMKRELMTLPGSGDASEELHERHVRTMRHEHGGGRQGEDEG